MRKHTCREVCEACEDLKTEALKSRRIIAEQQAIIARLDQERDEALDRAATIDAAREARLVTTNARLEQQARDISLWLAEAGIGPCPISEGVRTLLERAEQAEAAIAAAQQTIARLEQERDKLLAVLKDVELVINPGQA